MFNLKKELTDLFFPQKFTCNFCGREVFGKTAVCKDCEETLPYNDQAVCYRCGSKTPFPVEFCDRCSGKDWRADKSRSVFVYAPPVSFALQRLKYENQRYLAEFFAEFLYPLYMREIPACEVIIPVPLPEERLKERGYNQSGLIAERLSEKINVPVRDDIILKRKEAKSQVGLNARQRWANVSESFSVAKNARIDFKTALIVDDVLTTGATVNGIAKLLKGKGVEEVYSLTVANTLLDKRINT